MSRAIVNRAWGPSHQEIEPPPRKYSWLWLWRPLGFYALALFAHGIVDPGGANAVAWSLQALLVGGAVRDLLLGRSPKDFDLATSARPEVVRQLFRNARIIGRRFRLVELRFPSMAVEVSTLRGEPRVGRKGLIPSATN